VEDNKNVLMLYDAIKEHVEYLFGDRITALDEQPDGVLVAFASGAQKKSDLVIGADGPHSGVRALAFGPESEFPAPPRRVHDVLDGAHRPWA
jgi:2-polyprenyl-6-methoxyphenol hydroxylase-like FAD-dependent oxidoreductase